MSSFNDVFCILNTLVSLIIRQCMRHKPGIDLSLAQIFHYDLTNCLPVNTKLITHHSHSHTTFFLYSFSHFAMSPSLWTENGRPGLASSSVVSTPLSNRAYHLNICAQDKQLSPYTCLINSTDSAAVFPEFKTEFNLYPTAFPPGNGTVAYGRNA